MPGRHLEPDLMSRARMARCRPCRHRPERCGIADQGHGPRGNGVGRLHTPGHQAIVISSQGEKAIIAGDVLHNKAQVFEPDWTAGVDVDKAASRCSRAALLDLAEKEGHVVAAGHFHPDDHLGRVIRKDGKRFWQGL